MGTTVRKKVAVLALAFALATSLVPASMAFAADENSATGGGSPFDGIAEFFSPVVNALGFGDEAEAAEESSDANGDIQLFSAGEKGTDVADPSTIDGWNAILENEGQATTQNIGRIWTDKSVFTDTATFTQGPLANTSINIEGDHDFLVGLSALSSTSNTVTTTTVTTPLDIVLVLDDSGSMDDPIYNPVYDLNPNDTDGLYTPADGIAGWFSEFEQVHYENGAWYHGGIEIFGTWVGSTEFSPKTSPDDPNGVQVYERMTRTQALKNAVNNFIDQTAAENATIDLEANKHRISIVPFATGTHDVRGLTVCEGSGVTQLKNTVNTLTGNGATYADSGLERASSELANARDNAQKVVIFFTDGEPNHQSGFDGGVANDAIDAARGMKQNNTLIYSVGVFQDANPNDTQSAFNAYMHGVSSNYPNAQSYTNLGQRAEGNYYKAAFDASELNQIFEDIYEELPDSSTSGSPIESTEGVQGEVPGTLTFTDPLGDYMEVTGDTMTLVYGDQTYTAARGEDGVYRFPDQEVGGNAVYASANLSQIQINIKKGTGSAGDEVTVTMPASFIPLRNYQIDTDTGAMSVTPAYPIRLFYGVSVKSDAVDKLGDPSDTALQAYINANKTEDAGSVNFYANKWNDKVYGDAKASFTPSDGNKFYYYTAATPLYLDEGCTQPATEGNVSGRDTLYYKDTYWVQNSDGTTGTEVADGFSTVAVNGQDYAAADPTGEGGQLVIPAGTQRYDRPASLDNPKDDTAITNTAANVLHPTWEGSSVAQRLGNNGVLPVELPGTLEITKNVNADEGFTAPTHDSNNQEIKFTFQIELSRNDTGTGQAIGTDGNPVGPTFPVTSDSTFTLTAGQTMRITGLSAGTTYTVKEQNLPSGFRQTDPADNGSVKGTIAAGQTARGSFTNTYSSAPYTLHDTDFSAQKTFDGERTWHEGDSFEFQMWQSAGNPAQVTLPSNLVLGYDDQSNNVATGNFGDISLTRPGTYTFYITEIEPTENAIPGVNYSDAAYRLTVVVEDNHDGQLVQTSVTMAQVLDEAGNTVANAVESKVAAFTNTYAANEDTISIQGTKSYDDNSGANPLTDGKFTFKLRALGGYVTADGVDGGYSVGAANVPMPADVTIDPNDRSTTETNTGQNFSFDNITFTGDHVGYTYEYEVTEVQGSAANMDYDTETTHTVSVVVTETPGVDGQSADIHAQVTYPQGGVVFNNTYTPSSITLSGNTALGGSKIITGRDMTADESFTFTLAAADTEAMNNAVTQGWVKLPAEEDLTATVKNATQADADGTPFVFGDVTFTRAGEYEFTITENAPAQDGNGMTYDRHTCTVEVTIGLDDDSGALTLGGVDYGTYQDHDGNIFTNNYTSSIDYGAAGGIQVSKVLNGRSMNAGEFAFSIVAQNEADLPEWLQNGSQQSFVFATADEASAKLNTGEGGDAAFSNTQQRGSGQPEVMNKLQNATFTQADANKVFVYLVDETSVDTNTVAVDAKSYYVVIAVTDDGDGSMTIETTVYDAAATSGDSSVDTSKYDGVASTAPVVVPFVNTYTPLPVSTTDDTALQVTKQVTGAPAGEAFKFELTLNKDKTANSIEDGVFTDASATQAFTSFTKSTQANIAEDDTETLTFDQLTFTKAGTYYFDVVEKTTSKVDYWIYDNEPKTITVEVRDNNGQLEVVSPVAGNNPSVTNLYQPDSVVVGEDGDGQIDVTKTVQGIDFTGSFGFTLSPVDPQNEKWNNVEGLDDLAPVTLSGFTKGVDKSGTFGNLTFKAEGDYEFTVSETAVNGADLPATDPAGWAYDRTPDTVTVHVSKQNDAGSYDGVLHATVEGAASFTNTYTASGSIPSEGAGSLSVTKDFTGRANDAWLETDKFSFSIEPDMNDAETKAAVDGGFIENGTQTIDIDNKTADFTKAFDAIEFTEPGNHTYKFTVSEVLPDGANADSNWTKDGIAYDHEDRTVIINVTDGGNGNLTPSIDPASDSLTFENVYSTEDISLFSLDLGLEGNKVLSDPDNTGREFEATDSFEFTLRAYPGASTNPDGTAMDDAIVQATLPVKVSDTIAGITGGNEAQFSFADDSSTVEEDKFTFKQPGTYRYLIRETNPNVANPGSGILGVSYDETTYRLTVNVTDNGTGELEADFSYSKQAAGSNDWDDVSDSDGIVFTNVYSTESTNIGFNAWKQLTGDNRGLADNQFTFHIEFAGWKANGADDSTYAMTGADYPMPDPAETRNIRNGNIIFSEMAFTHDHVGKTFRYAITEEQPTQDGTYSNDPADGIEGAMLNDDGNWVYQGVTYDHTAHYVTAEVTAEGTGNVEAVRVHTSGEANADNHDDGAVFTNTYAASGSLTGDAQLGVTKKVAGADFTADMTFNFTMKLTDMAGGAAIDGVQVAGADGQMVPLTDEGVKAPITGGEGVTDGQKTVGFGDMVFTKAGDYTFTVTEDEADGAVPEHWTYDNSDKTIAVHVSDNYDGTLTVTVDPYDTTFTNTYFNPGEAKSAVAVDGNDKVTSQDGTKAMVGDTITYTINWMNNAVDQNGAAVTADVTVCDRIPAGTTLVKNSITDGGTVQDGVITWTFADQEPGASGSVSFQVTVDEGAAGTTVENAAWFNNDPDVTTNTVQTQVGEGDLTISKTVELVEGQGTEIDMAKLFEFTLSLKDWSGKDLAADYEIEGAYDKDGKPITTVADGSKFYLHHGDTATISALPDGAVVVVDETDILNDGYSQSQPNAGMSGTAGIDAERGPANISFVNLYNAEPGEVPGTGETDQAFNLTKQFTGRDGNAWLDTDEFSFTLAPVDGAPMPTEGLNEDGTKTVTVGAANVADPENGIAPINFGDITYATAGTYKYTVTEANAGKTINGVTYDGDTVNITVTVTDNGSGKLTAAVAKTGVDANASFTNTYDSTIHYGADGKGGLAITKQLNNRDMTAGQFTMTVTAADDASAEKIGGQTVELKSAAAAANTAAPVTGSPFDNVTFKLADAGKTFIYTIAETGTAPAGYQFDSNVYTVSITPRDNGDGTMTVSTRVSSEGGYNETTEGVATVPFVNTYDPDQTTVGANGSATIVAYKTLENDDIANYEGAFAFKVADGDTVVATGSNDAAGNITFSDIAYTSEELYKATHGGSDVIGTAIMTTDEATGNEVYTFAYSVAEDAISGDNGVSYVSGNGGVTVVVTDDHSGKLSAEVVYDNNAQSIEFVNAYGTGTDGSTTLTLAGSKQLVGVDGAQAPVLEAGQFNFSIVGNAAEDGTPAPMPETTTAANAQSGAVSFGPITYTMENVFGAEAAATDESATADEAVEGEAAATEGVETYTVGRTKIFTYTVTENNGGQVVDGITYDASSQTIEVTVTDEGDGKISAAVTGVSDAAKGNDDFTFVNTYSVKPADSTPTGNGALTFTKVWDRQGGTRELAEGDFTFRLADAAGNVVATGTNDAAGNVAMGSITFKQAGDYSYTLTEVVPEGAAAVDGGYEKDGVFYPSVRYTVTAHVVDNHDGTLGVTWTMTDASGKDATEATIANTYSVSDTTVTFGAAKALEGRAVEDGEFTFELRDADDKVLGTATNDAEGKVVFADAVQTFGAAGEYDFVIAEALPEDDDPATEGIQKDGVTYDETTYEAHVVVTDNGKGALEVTELTYNGEAALPVFHNTYVEPEEPVAPAPEEPADGPDEPKFAQTNDSTPWMLIAGIAVVAAALVAVGAFGLLRTRRR